jgi:hypothetical protein
VRPPPTKKEYFFVEVKKTILLDLRLFMAGFHLNHLQRINMSALWKNHFDLT